MRVGAAAAKVRAFYARFLAIGYTLVLDQTYCKRRGKKLRPGFPHPPDRPPSTVRPVRS